MNPVSRSGTPITDFLGLISNQGRIASDQGAMTALVLENLGCIAPGVMTTRPGLRPVVYDEDPEQDETYVEP